MGFKKVNTLSTGKPRGSGNKIDDVIAKKIDDIISGIITPLTLTI